jgi:hypothetical protein
MKFKKLGVKVEKLTSTFTGGTPVIHGKPDFNTIFNSEEVFPLSMYQSAENMCCKFCSQLGEMM